MRVADIRGGSRRLKRFEDFFRNGVGNKLAMIRGYGANDHYTGNDKTRYIAS